MKKKVLILGVCSLLLCGCGKIPTLSNGDEAVVTFKDGDMISANDFYEEIKNNYGLNTLINMIDKYVFEKEFFRYFGKRFTIEQHEAIALDMDSRAQSG